MGDAFLTGYYSLYFIARGMDIHQQAVLLAIIPFSVFLGCLVIGEIARTRKLSIWFFRVCALIEAGLTIGFIFCHSFYALLAVTFFLGFFNGAPFSLIEGYLVPMVKARGGNYSTIRMFGSLGYIVSLAGGYFFLNAFPLENTYYLAAAFFLTALGLSFLLHEDPNKDFERHEEQTAEKPSKASRLLTPAVILFFLSQLFFYGAYNASSYLLPVYLNKLGFRDADYSLARAIGVGVELVFLLFLPLLAKYNKNKKIPIYISIVMVILGTASVTAFKNPWLVAYGNLVLTHIGKAFLFASQAIFVAGLVHKEVLGKALTINAGGINFASALLNLVSSRVYETWGVYGLYGALTIFEAVGLVFFFTIPKGEATPKQA